jgi:acyl carrier protein
MTDLERTLVLLVRAHAPATTSAAMAMDDPSQRLRDDLGFDLIALAELAVAIEHAFGIDLDVADLGACQTVADLQRLIAARSA